MLRSVFRGMALVFVAALVAACDNATILRAILPAPSAADIEEAQVAIAPYCSERNGTVIRRTVDDVEGFVFRTPTTYADGLQNPPTGGGYWGCNLACFQYLLAGYRFVEAEVRLPPGDKELSWDFAGSPAGLYRYELADRDSGRCARFDQLIERHGGVRALALKNEEFLDGRCVAATPIEKFTARFVYEHFDAVVAALSKEDGTYILSGGKHIYDRLTGERIGSTEFITVENSKYQSKILAHCEQPDHWLEPADVLHPVSGGAP